MGRTETESSWCPLDGSTPLPGEDPEKHRKHSPPTKIILLYTWVLCLMCIGVLLHEIDGIGSAEDIGSAGTGVTENYELPCGCF